MGTWQVTLFTSNDLPIDVLGQHTPKKFLKTHKLRLNLSMLVDKFF